MSTTGSSKASQLCLPFGLAIVLLCSLATTAHVDDQTMRTLYNTGKVAQSSGGTPKLEWSQFDGSAHKSSNGGGSSAFGTPSASPVTPVVTPTFGSSGSAGNLPPPAFGNSSDPLPASGSGYNQPTFGGGYHPQSGGFGGIPAAVGNLLGPGHHLPSAAPNPATMPFQGGESAQEAEHRRVLSNMRAHGYSEARINSMEPYIHQTDAPGTTYRNVMGIKVRNDGMTFDQAFSNVKNSGLMNTPMSTDYHDYGSNEYGYYKGRGGTKTFGQWLDGQR